MLATLLRRLNQAPVFQRQMQVWGHAFRASSADRLLYLSLHRLGLMGKDDLRDLTSLVRPGMVIVDVGANVGLYTLLLAELTGPGGRVHAFEPEPALFETMRTNCARNGATHVRAVNAAVGETSGRAAFTRSAIHSGDNRFGDLSWRGERLEVDVVRLDDALAGEPIDFVKMDVQGYELGVLRGMTGLIAKNPRMEIYFELCPSDLLSSGTEPVALMAHLRGQGFRLYHAEGGAFVPVEDDAALVARFSGGRYTNVLARRPP